MLVLRHTHTHTRESSPARKAEHVASGDSDSSRRQRLLIGGLSQSHLLAFPKEASGENGVGEGERSSGMRWAGGGGRGQPVWPFAGRPCHDARY